MKGFDTFNYQFKGPLSLDKNGKKVLGKTKDELGWAMKELVGLRPKLCSCLMYDDEEKRE